MAYTFKRGVGNWGSAWIDGVNLKKLKKSGIDHVRFVCRGIPVYPYTSNPPTWTFDDLVPTMERVNKCHKAGLGTIIGLEIWRQENKRIFFRNIALNENTGELTLRPDQDYKWSQYFYKTMAQAFAVVDPEKYMFSLHGGEPGFFNTDTGNAGIVESLYPAKTAEDKATLAAKIFTGSTVWGTTNNPARVAFTSLVAQSLNESLSAYLRSIVPWCKIITTGPSYGALTGPKTYVNMHPERIPNCMMDAHQYGPRALTHNGQNGAELKPYIWPDPTAKWKELGGDLAWINYEFDSLPWTRESLVKIYGDFAVWCATKGVPGIVTECGVIATCRQTEASQAFLADTKYAIESVGLGYTEWLG